MEYQISAEFCHNREHNGKKSLKFRENDRQFQIQIVIYFLIP